MYPNLNGVILYVGRFNLTDLEIQIKIKTNRFVLHMQEFFVIVDARLKYLTFVYMIASMFFRQ